MFCTFCNQHYDETKTHYCGLNKSQCVYCGYVARSINEVVAHNKQVHPGLYFNINQSVEKPESHRKPIKMRYDAIEPDFMEALALIGQHANEVYGRFNNYQDSRLTGNKGPVNHILKHLTKYRQGEPYDHTDIGTHKKYHLAAIAYNAMMEFWYESQSEKQTKGQEIKGPIETFKFYGTVEEKKQEGEN